MSSLDRRFFANLGATRQTGSLCGATAKTGFGMAYEGALSADPMDIEHSKLIVLWATNTRLTNRHLWPFIERARAAGARVVVIDCLRTVTADSADLFHQPRPGTDLALVLALAHVLIRDGLVDEDFVQSHALGYEGFARSVQAWTPVRAAAECGVEASAIEELARELATTRPAMIRTLIGAEHHADGALFYQALGAIPVLTGAWRDRGGGMARSVGSWSNLAVDDSCFDVPNAARAINMNHLGRALVDPEQGIHALFIWNGNPLVSTPNAGAFRKGLEREDLFVAVSEQFMTDTAAYADVIFPATTQIEQLDVVPSWGSLYLGWNNPAIEPCGEAVPNTELWRRLAHAMGMDDPEFRMTDRELIEAALYGIEVDRMERETWVRVPAPDVANPFNAGLDTAQLPTADFNALSWPRLGEDELVMMAVKRHPRFMNSSYSAHHGPRESPPLAEIHPSDAARLGVTDGEMVELRNGQGALRLTASVTERGAVGVVTVPWGWWGEDLNVNLLTSDELTDAGGGVSFFDSVVSVSPASVTSPRSTEMVWR
jgi:anaerobic selenocysteine-containing dehydrogenase